MATRFVPGGYKPELAGETTVQRVRRAVEGLGDLIDGYGFDLYPYTEDAVAAVRRSVLQWRFIDSVAERLDGDELRAAQAEKDAVRAYELVYAALGA
jgi:hypothetical protein